MPTRGSPAGRDRSRRPRQYFLTSRQGVLRSRCRRSKPRAVGRQRPEEGPFPVLADAGPRHVGEQRPGRVEQDLPPLPVPLLGDVEVVLDAVGLEMADAGGR